MELDRLAGLEVMSRGSVGGGGEERSAPWRVVRFVGDDDGGQEQARLERLEHFAHGLPDHPAAMVLIVARLYPMPVALKPVLHCISPNGPTPLPARCEGKGRP